MFLGFRLLRRGLGAIVMVVVVSIGATAAWVVGQSFREDTTRTDALVIMGAAQFNGVPSPVLRTRLDRAYALYRQGVAGQIVTVGGSQPGDVFTEATSGRLYLQHLGVPRDRITAVRTGTDTFNSAAAIAGIARARGWRSITMVTDRMHEARATAMMASFGFTVHPAPPPAGPGSSRTPDYLVRETGGLLYFWLVQQHGSTA